MIDFEQLKISNVDLTEKIEERNEDILKLKGKVDSTIQILAHLKEKLQFMQVRQSLACTELKNLKASVGNLLRLRTATNEKSLRRLMKLLQR